MFTIILNNGDEVTHLGTTVGITQGVDKSSLILPLKKPRLYCPQAITTYWKESLMALQKVKCYDKRSR